MRTPSSVANTVLDELGVTQEDLVKHLNEIARERGALVNEASLDGSEARLNMTGDPAIITVSSHNRSTRKRFSIAHELGHLEMHKWKVTLCTTADMMEWSIKKGSVHLEHEANEFASALLMPERFYASHCDEDPSLDYFADLATTFDVSLTASALRYCKFTDEPIAIVFSQDGHIKWFRASKEFEEMGLFVSVHGRVYEGSRAAQFFQGKTVPTAPKRISADTWLRPGDYDRKAQLLEQSRSLGSYNAVLTLLWIDSDF